jgi:hypothetical protein
MLKNIIALFFLCCFIACDETGKKVDGIAVAENDTFDFFSDEYDIPILQGFSVDTLKYYNKQTDYSETIICPKIIGKEFEQLNEILEKEIKGKVALVYLDSTNNEPVDTSKEILGVVEENILLTMHKNKNLVSYGFLSMFDEPNSMRPFRKYFTINYDTALKHFILFNNYFKIAGHHDSTLVRSIIYSGVGSPDFAHVSLDNEINFSFDEKNVYFYFDMFGGPGNPMGLVKRVKKKYLARFIKEEYK